MINDSDDSNQADDNADLHDNDFPSHMSENERAAREAALRKGAAQNHKGRVTAVRHDRANQALGTEGLPANAPGR